MTTETAAATAATVGLRESKKQETRQLISDAATRLFLDQGFEQTTIAEIAAAARVAKKTVTNYFGHKEDLALDHQDAFTGSLAATVADRAPGESALTALRHAFAEAVAAADPVAGFSGPEFARMVADSPTLTARLRDLHDLREVRLAEVLAETTGAAPDDIAVRTAAALLGSVHRMLFDRIQERTLAGWSNSRIGKELAADADHAFGMLEEPLAGYAAGPSPDPKVHPDLML